MQYIPLVIQLIQWTCLLAALIFLFKKKWWAAVGFFIAFALIYNLPVPRALKETNTSGTKPQL